MNQRTILTLPLLWPALWASGPNALPASAGGAEREVPAVAAEIRTEALRRNDDPAGRQLPLAANWNVPNWDGDYQVEMVRGGHHILPWIGHPDPTARGEQFAGKYLETNGKALRTWAAWKMPITMRDQNYAMGLTKSPYKDLPPERNPNTIRPDGSVWTRPSPLGAVEPWRQVGRSLTDFPLMKKIQELYPDPPLVVFLSNNETRKLRWHELGESRRYLDKHGTGRAGEFQRKLVGDGWVERFGALLGGMREALVSATWRKNAIFIGYGAFGPACYGRWDGWKDYAMCTPDRIAPQPLYWNGGSPSFYDNDWETQKADYLVWSPQIEAMNWPFMIEEARKLNGEFWFEISVWDGAVTPGSKRRGKPAVGKPDQYLAKGQTWTPARYEGRVQFGMWLVRPRVLREFRGHGQPREPFQAYWDVIVRCVDRVWQDKTLRRFWRKGRLVPNRQHEHPWQADVLAKYKSADRWFLLDTSLDAPRPWNNATKIRVFALARVMGEKPARQWLVYAHAPLGEEKGVEIHVPGYRGIKVDAAVAGSFYLVSETDGRVEAVTDGR
jgi:hypothetical protein